MTRTLGPALTIRDLIELCDQYVPVASRHPNSLESPHVLWWPAHEIGHLLTAPVEGIGQPMFGMDVEALIDQDLCDEHELRSRELAAMDVSRRLLVAAGRADLARVEFEDTDHGTVCYDDRGRVREILREHRVRRLPGTRHELECVIRRVLEDASALVVSRAVSSIDATGRRRNGEVLE